MYYLRQRTRVSGPFTADQIKALLHRGRIARSDKVSTDRSNWRSIAETRELIERPQEAAPIVDEPAETTSQDTRLWHHTKSGVQESTPVDTETLRQLVQAGVVGPTDLVWTDGYGDWQPVSSVSEFAASPIELPGFAPPQEFPPVQQFPPPQFDAGFGELPPVVRKKGWP